MNKNIKKVATVILATNVLASTVISTLPIGTHAEETDLTAAEKARLSIKDVSASNDGELTIILDKAVASGYRIDILSMPLGGALYAVGGINYAVPDSMFTYTTDENGDIVAKTRLHNAKGETVTFTIYTYNLGSLVSFNFHVPTDAESVAQKAVNDLFNDGDKALGIKAGVTQADIDAAQVLINNNVAYADLKKELQADLDAAQKALTDREEEAALKLAEATSAVNNLFADAPTNSKLKEDTTQAMIDEADAKVNALPASITKTDLQMDVSRASEEFSKIVTTTIDALTSDSTSVSGTGEPNADVVIKNGVAVIATGKVNSNGSYSISIPKQAGGVTITASVTKLANGKTSVASTVVKDENIATTTIVAMTSDSTSISGTGEPNATVVIKNGEKTITTGKVASDGTYFFNVEKQAGGSVISATVTKESNGKTSQASTTIPVAKDYSLIANVYTLGDAQLTGKYGKDIPKVRLWVNGLAVTQATLNADGTYTFANASSFIKSASDKVEIVGVDNAYKELGRITVTMQGAIVIDKALTVVPYAKDDATLTGTYGKDVSKVRLWVNGVVVAQASTSNGNYTFANAASFIKNKTDVVEVVGVDAQYKELNRIAVVRTGFDGVAVTAPTNFKLGTDIEIAGTCRSDVDKVRLWVNGKVAKQAIANADGTYNLTYANGFIKATTDLVEVVAVDAQYKELGRVTVNVIN